MAGPFQQTTNAVQQVAMWMKGPEQWFAIVWALGMSFLLNYVFNLHMTVYRSTTPSTMMIMTTCRHHTIRHLTITNVPGGEQGTGIRERDSRRISSPRCIFFFFFSSLLLLIIIIIRLVRKLCQLSHNTSTTTGRRLVQESVLFFIFLLHLIC
jgi:hypothetical protein